jgi:hypothetical protein
MEEQNKLSLDHLAVDALRESAKWCMFLAIVGFIGIGLMVIFGAFMTFAMSVMPQQDAYGGMPDPFMGFKAYIGAFYIVIALIYFFPVYYLYNYAKGTKQAVETGNNGILSTALVNLKSHHKFLGIFTIIMIAVYVLAIVGVMIFAASFAAGAGHM